MVIQMGQHLFSASSLLYQVYTVWLFTRSDLKTIVGPQAAFSIICTLSGPVLTTQTSPCMLEVIRQIPAAVFWVWVNLLPFNIANQRQSKAIEEDSINKPWRALPTKRLLPEQATYLMMLSYLAAILTSLRLGGLRSCVAMILLGFYYNELGGADNSFVVRNLVNAAGFLSFASGATEVALNRLHSSLNHTAYPWFFVIGAIVFSTVQSQDMSDQEGDDKRGRKTVPLVLGDEFARWSIAIPVLLWSCFCPWFLGLPAWGYLHCLSMGSIVAYRTILRRTVDADKTTFKIWNAWMVAIYLLPLIKRLSME